jgi:hypothetical protein
VISPDERAVFRPLDDGGVILNVESGDYFQVNSSGRLIWETLAGGAQRQELVDKLALDFQLSHEQASADVDSFLGQLEERSLINVGA